MSANIPSDGDSNQERTQEYKVVLGEPELAPELLTREHIGQGQTLDININGQSLYAPDSVYAAIGAKLRIPAVLLVGGLHLGVADLRQYQIPGRNVYPVDHRDMPNGGAIFRYPFMLIDMDRPDLLHHRGHMGLSEETFTHFGHDIHEAVQRFGEALTEDAQIGGDHLSIGVAPGQNQMILADNDPNGVTVVQARPAAA